MSQSLSQHQPVAAPAFVDTKAVQRAFSRAAATYSQHDFLAREIDRRMLERLDYVRIEPQRIVDLGCSLGASLPALRQRYPQALALGVDFSPAMLARAQALIPAWRRWLPITRPSLAYLGGDANALPLAHSSAGLIWSNLLLHWLDDPRPAFAEAHRVLEVGGLLMFSCLGPDSFKELRSAFADGYAHTQRFADMHDLGDMLVHAGFADPVMDMEVLTLTYESFDALLAELRSSGSYNAMHTRSHGLSGRGIWQAAREAYGRLAIDDRLPVTIEVVYGHAWKALPNKTADGRSVIQFSKRPK